MAIDWTTIYRKHKGKWVALADDEKTVVGVGGSPREARDAARNKGCEKPILTRMPENLKAYVGHEV